MKILIIPTVLVLAISSMAQNDSYEKYMRSFKQEKKGGIINFEKIAQNINPMSREEALKFVYNGDTSKLVCISQNFNMISEKKGSVLRSTRFPNKSMLLDMDNCFLLAHLSYECHDPSKSQQSFLTLTIVNKKYQPTDRLEVFRSGGDFTEVMGLLNSNKGMIFLDGLLKSQSKIDAAIYAIDAKTLKFKILKESSNIKGDYSNLSKTIKNLGWEELFMIGQ